MNGSDSTHEENWSLRKKIAISIVLAVHVFAVFAAPCASPPPASDLFQRISGRIDGRDGLLTPYLRAMYLNHGYRFFAPNPGPSHLVRYEIDLAAGGSIEGYFPDTEEHFPRLLYHRMFMLSETAFNVADPVLTIPEAGVLSPAEQQTFDRQLAAANALANSIARRMLQDHGGKRIRLYLRTHELPFPSDVLAGQKLNDPDLYSERFWCEISQARLSDNAETLSGSAPHVESSKDQSGEALPPGEREAFLQNERRLVTDRSVFRKGIFPDSLLVRSNLRLSQPSPGARR